MGFCFKYKVYFELKDSCDITGYFILQVYDEFYGSIDSFDTILKRISRPKGDTLTIYKEIFKIDNIRIGKRIYSIYATPKNHIKKINSSDIINSEILNIERCCSPEMKLGDDSYYIEHCCIPVITELNQNEIDKLKSQIPNLKFIYRDCPDEVMLTLVVISFNNSLTREEIESKISKLYCEIELEDYSEYLRHYNDFKNHFRQENVIIFKNCF